MDRTFKFDPRALLTLGRDSIKDHTTAVVELVKNGYDADADTIEVQIFANAQEGGLIRIADSGIGMSEREVESNWLRIGFSEKRANPVSTKYRRRKTGEKGIGRLSSDRLGSILSLRTLAQRGTPFGLEVDWSRFEKEGQELSSISIPALEDPQPTLPVNAKQKNQGTELRITHLRQSWSRQDIVNLRSELSLLLPPYGGISDAITLRFASDVAPELDGAISPMKQMPSEIELEATVDKLGRLRTQLRVRGQRASKRKAVSSFIGWKELKAALNLDASRSYTAGPLSIRLSYYPRKPENLEGTNFSLGQLRTFLAANVGVRIYRDHVRVKPYGDPLTPEGDWLGLSDRKIRNPAGAGREDFRISANQLVGAVFISRDQNKALIDSSSREGLIESDEFRLLKALVMHCVRDIEVKYHQLHIVEKSRETTKAAKAKAAVTELRKELSTLKSDLAALSESDGPSGPVLEQIELVIEHMVGAERYIEEIASQTTVYRGLATVGIASAVFGHETEISTDLAQASLTLAKTLLRKDKLDVEAVRSEVMDAEKYLQRIASWGKFALLRVKKDKRQKQNVSVTKVVSDVLNELKGPLKESSIDLKDSLAEVSARTFPMDVEAVLINYVTNAYYAVKKTKKNRQIKVTLRSLQLGGRQGFELSVLDSGPGVDKKHDDIIWEPLFSTRVDEDGKSVGTGLGLSIVKSAVEELKGVVSMKGKGALGGAQFTAWFPDK